MIQHIIKFNLTGRQVAEMCEKSLNENADEEETSASPQAIRLVKAIQKLPLEDEDDFLQGLLDAEQSIQIARARIDATIEFLTRAKLRLPEA
jgi:hypothetical protein